MIFLLLIFAPVLLLLFVIYQMIKAVLVFITALVLLIVDKR
jgi:hypothetical protein